MPDEVSAGVGAGCGFARREAVDDRDEDRTDLVLRRVGLACGVDS